jgi:hypothetical protein
MKTTLNKYHLILITVKVENALRIIVYFVKARHFYFNQLCVLYLTCNFAQTLY